MYVLIVISFVTVFRGSDYRMVTMQDFSSKETCETAATYIRTGTINTVCLRK